MKKIIILTLLMAMGIAAMAQNQPVPVQSGFFGCEFGASMGQLKSGLKEAGYRVQEEDGKLLATTESKSSGIKLETVSFDYANIFFSKDGEFYQVNFVSRFGQTDIASAKKHYAGVKQALETRYPIREYSEDNDYPECGYSDYAGKKSVVLGMEMSKGKDGRIYNYVTLSYYDIEMHEANGADEDEDFD